MIITKHGPEPYEEYTPRDIDWETVIANAVELTGELGSPSKAT